MPCMHTCVAHAFTDGVCKRTFADRASTAEHSSGADDTGRHEPMLGGILAAHHKRTAALLVLEEHT
jgi:hypothetical protein